MVMDSIQQRWSEQEIKDDTVRGVNQKIRTTIGEEAFEDRLRSLLRKGLVEITSVEQDGTPNVKVTQKGLDEFFKRASQEQS
jgi:hypothetical protein